MGRNATQMQGHWERIGRPWAGLETSSGKKTGYKLYPLVRVFSLLPWVLEREGVMCLWLLPGA